MADNINENVMGTIKYVSIGIKIYLIAYKQFYVCVGYVMDSV